MLVLTFLVTELCIFFRISLYLAAFKKEHLGLSTNWKVQILCSFFLVLKYLELIIFDIHGGVQTINPDQTLNIWCGKALYLSTYFCEFLFDVKILYMEQINW